ncbi:MAG: TlpA disulfide reductase family protein [Gemmataceae bacterium]|nr:TlpA family protein disulfide reductase [Gemmata sp.]MDW8198867.1 TlpA disulfide reductase family protein [Gemmataceae bacterium]
MRLLCAALLSLACGLWVAFADDKKANEPHNDRAAKLAELKKKYETTFNELRERFAKAEPADRRGIQAEIREETLLMISKAIKIAEENPKDAVAFDAVAFILEKGGMVGVDGPDIAKAVQILGEHHVANPKVKDFLLLALNMGEAGEKLLKAVSEKATDNEAKGMALFLRGYLKAQNINDDANEAVVAAQVKEATELLEQAMKLAPTMKVGRSGQTIADFAKREIDSLTAILSLGIGKPAPDVTSKLLDGKEVKLSDYKGKVVLLDIWATWCGPCRAMIPHERELVKKLKDKPFVLISVSADDKKETLEKFLEKEEMPWVHWWNDGPRSEVLTKYRVRAFPTLYIIDHNGIIKHKWIGNPGNDKIDAAIEELVKVAEKAKG